MDAEGHAGTRNYSVTIGSISTARNRVARLNADLTLDTSFVANDDSGNYLEYLRGNRSKEITSGLNDVSRVYRERANLVGDINGSRVTVVAAPNLNLSDATNAGYGTTDHGSVTASHCAL